jgi:uncharacterized protein (DUF433 family)
MTRNSLKLPPHLAEEAEQWADRQGVSLEEFIVWAVAEKVGGLKQGLDDPNYPHVTYRRSAAGWPVPFLRGTGIRVRTIVGAVRSWSLSPSAVAEEYDLTEEQVADALGFYETHRGEIEASLSEERLLEQTHA